MIPKVGANHYSPLVVYGMLGEKVKEEIIKSGNQELIKELILINKNKTKENRLKYQLLETFNKIYDFDTQVKCGNYYIDFVLNNNIAIECDENNHKNYNDYEEKQRGEYIKSKGYKMIRYNPDGDDTIFNLINKVLKGVIK